MHYVTVEGSLQPALAGGLAFVLFGVSALMREIGGKLAGSRVPVLLAGAMPWLAAVGLAAIGLDLSTGVVTGAVLLMAAGFALPYATMMVEGQRLFPAEPRARLRCSRWRAPPSRSSRSRSSARCSRPARPTLPSSS